MTSLLWQALTRFYLYSHINFLLSYLDRSRDKLKTFSLYYQSAYVHQNCQVIVLIWFVPMHIDMRRFNHTFLQDDVGD